jgi:predicted RNase H-like nuclease (RuvC/YqgF family)
MKCKICGRPLSITSKIKRLEQKRKELEQELIELTEMSNRLYNLYPGSLREESEEAKKLIERSGYDNRGDAEESFENRISEGQEEWRRITKELETLGVFY